MTMFSLCFQEVHSQDELNDINYRELILNPKNASDLIKGYRHFLNAKEDNLKKFDTIKAVYDLRLISIALKKRGILSESEEYAIEALELLDKYNRKDSIANEAYVGLNNHLGLINKELENYDNAIDYFKKVIAYAKETENKNTGIKNLAMVYSKNRQYKKAIKGYLSIIEYTKENESQIKLARLLDNLGSAQSKIDNPHAILNLNEALKIRIEANHFSGIITSYLHLAEYNKNRGNIAKALDFADKAVELSQTIKNEYYEMNALAFKMTLNNDKEIVRYKILNDSIQSAQQQFKNQFASDKYEVAKEKKRADRNEILKEKERSKKIISQSIALIVLMLMIFVVLWLKSKHKKDKIKEAYQKETELSKKVHDELANDMSDLMNFVEKDIEVTETKKALLLDNIEDIYLRTRDISTETGSIDLLNFPDSIKHLLMQHNKKDTKVVTNDINAIDWQNVSEYKKVVIYRCLQELLVNMKKHSKAKVVSVVFKNRNKKNEIRYVDDGVGFDREKSKRNGLLNVESRIKGIGGSFNFTTSKGNGFKATLEFNS
ncbi:tetratricopeptide repeat-containing sensor histidine kinase [Winogradskyella luteola]|uniref:Tetratricopeptide repeat protein n=1 Tax=Winogradskyella luteola TaxID=2828330 RepID=A0A9X1F618_9FLAO|nr:hypothetical protein [Winogradskyella luteola]MBV7268036.1 hypothetical protein [Winogradskyella luteola]